MRIAMSEKDERRSNTLALGKSQSSEGAVPTDHTGTSQNGQRQESLKERETHANQAKEDDV